MYKIGTSLLDALKLNKPSHFPSFSENVIKVGIVNRFSGLDSNGKIIVVIMNMVIIEDVSHIQKNKK